MLDQLIAALGAAAKGERRRAADDLIPRMGEARVRHAVRAALSDASAERRWGATFVSHRAGIDDDAVFAGALEALDSADGDVRWSAAEIAVAQSRGKPVRTAALVGLAEQGKPNARKMALYCLRDLGAASEAVCLAGLDAGDSGVRLAAIAAARAQEKVSDTLADKLVERIGADADAGVQRAAAVALGPRVRTDPAWRARLLGLRESSADPELRRAIDRALAMPVKDAR